LRDALAPGYPPTGGPQNGRVGRPEGVSRTFLEVLPPRPLAGRWAAVVGDARGGEQQGLPGADEGAGGVGGGIATWYPSEVARANKPLKSREILWRHVPPLGSANSNFVLLMPLKILNGKAVLTFENPLWRQ